MGNADYVAAFLHVLLPVAFEVTVWGWRRSQWQGVGAMRCPEWNRAPGVRRVSLEGPPLRLSSSFFSASPHRALPAVQP